MNAHPKLVLADNLRPTERNRHSEYSMDHYLPVGLRQTKWHECPDDAADSCQPNLRRSTTAEPTPTLAGCHRASMHLTASHRPVEAVRRACAQAHPRRRCTGAFQVQVPRPSQPSRRKSRVKSQIRSLSRSVADSGRASRWQTDRIHWQGL